MLRIGITGNPQHGKNALGDGIKSAAESGIITESSTVIGLAADYFNTQLTNCIGSIACDNPDVLGPFIDRVLPPAVAAATPLRFDGTKLCFNRADFSTQPENYDNLHAYIEQAKQDPSILERKFTQSEKELYRPLLQWIGARTTIQLGRSLWYEEIVRRSDLAISEGCDAFVVAGLRFPDDATVWRRAGGFIIEVNRPGMRSLFAADATETSRSLIQPDIRVINDGSLDDLHRAGQRLYADLMNDRPRKLYTSSLFAS